MPVYIYETIPPNEDEEVERFEVKQSMLDDALTVHPDSGKPVRRVITGGIPMPTKSSGNCDDGGGCCSNC